MHCRDGEHDLPPECPQGHGQMVITPRGEKARCPVLTGRDERGETTWCSALWDPVSYGPGNPSTKAGNEAPVEPAVTHPMPEVFQENNTVGTAPPGDKEPFLEKPTHPLNVV